MGLWDLGRKFYLGPVGTQLILMKKGWPGEQFQVTQPTPKLTERAAWVGLAQETELGDVALIKTPSLH